VPLHQKLKGSDGKGVLTGAELGSASVLRWTSGSKRKKSPKLGSPAAHERHEYEEHQGVHRRLEAKGTALISGGRVMCRGGQRKRTPVMRPEAKEVQGHGDELCARNQ
jgi:hypothetical protein